MKQIIRIYLLLIFSLPLAAQVSYKHEFSTAGFFQISNGGREVFNFNVGWRFKKGSAVNAEQTGFDDSLWSIVNTPHGLKYLPDEASGGINYQGERYWCKYAASSCKIREGFHMG
jgi:beta-galactosidase